MSTQIEGRNADTAVLLLAAAEDLGLPASVVETTSGGYRVPDEVADKAGLGEKPKQEPAKKVPTAKKAPTKKTTTKKTAAKKTASKPKGKE